MKIYGLQKMTLLDFPGKVACTVFLGLCDFRCPFCHNFELVDGTAPVLYTEEEFFEYISKRRGLLDGVAITGGEPCVHRDLPEFISKIRDLGFQVKLDTNGNHPAILKEVLDRGLVDYVAMDIKNSPEKYAMTAGLDHLDLGNIKESISLIMGSGIGYEFRTTVVNELHSKEDFTEIGQLIKGARKYVLQNFTDRDTVPFGGFNPASKQDLEDFAWEAGRFVESAEIRGVD
ncbi:MAG: anaerobic ribonucleoside-triphosphate reductase activating protein [Clostridia bacterium]|nr:anaerobic ribonucleoside-triphosphate reductase activating protein [Clostridia bacterium]